MSRRSLVTAAVALVTLAGLALAQPPEKKPTPLPEHTKLQYFVGTWKGEGTMKESPLGPGGTMESSETCEWFTGNFFLVCRSQAKGPMGDIRGQGLLGYSADEKVYTYYSIDNAGNVDQGKGTLEGDTWTWEGESRPGGKVMKSRYRMKTSPTSYRFTWETSMDGGPWTTIMEGTARKAK